MKSGTKVVLVVVLLVAVVGGVTFYNRLKSSGGELVKKVKRASSPVQVVAPRPEDLVETVIYTGTLRAERDVILTPEVGGKIVRVSRELGDRCRRGELLVQLDSESFRIAMLSADAALKQARAQANQARRELARARKLKLRNALASQAVEQAETASLSADALTRRAEAALRMARRNVRETAVRCPFDGVLARRMVEQGQTVGPQTPLARLVDNRQLRLEAKVSAADLSRVAVGQQVTLADPATPRVRYPGKVARLGVAGDQVTHTFPVEVQVVPVGGQPRPGQVMRATIAVARHPAALAVPAEAVVRDDGATWLVLAQQGKAHRIKVQLGPTIGARVIVRSGLKAGQPVIVEGQQGLKEGATVAAVSQDQTPTPADGAAARGPAEAPPPGL